MQRIDARLTVATAYAAIRSDRPLGLRSYLAHYIHTLVNSASVRSFGSFFVSHYIKEQSGLQPIIFSHIQSFSTPYQCRTLGTAVTSISFILSG